MLLRVARGPAGRSHTVLDETGSLCLGGASGVTERTAETGRPQLLVARPSLRREQGVWIHVEASFHLLADGHVK